MDAANLPASPHGNAGSPDEEIEPISFGCDRYRAANRASHIALRARMARRGARFERTSSSSTWPHRRRARTVALTAAREDVDNRFWKQGENGRRSEGP